MKDDRLAAIRQHLYSHGFSSVQDISEAVGASPATIRRDLQALHEGGVVARSHGGARISSVSGVEIAFALREQQDLPAKRAIADAAFELLEPDRTVFLDASTTVLQLARRLRLDPLPLSVFTNGLVVAQTLMDLPDVDVTVIGGRLRSENASMVGAAAEAMIGRLRIDLLFLGASGISEDARLYSLDESEARLNERMMACSGTTVLLADRSKFGRRATHLVGAIDPAMKVISDEGVSEEWRRRLAETGCAPSYVPVRPPTATET